MPPLLAVVHILPNAVHRGIRLWVPLFLIWLLLLPFLLVLLPVYFVVCAVIDIDPFETLGAILRRCSEVSTARMSRSTVRQACRLHSCLLKGNSP